MDNIRKTLKIIFGDYCPDLILKEKYTEFYLSFDHFIEYAFSNYMCYSLDEIRNIYKMMNDDWCYNINSKQRNYFQILNNFTESILIEENNELYVIFEQLLKWRDVSFYLGEDILTTSYFANLDNLTKYDRKFFSWKSTIFSNNFQLNKILKEGISDNHFHLKGSGPVFDINWINLMNHSNDLNFNLKSFTKEINLRTNINNSPRSSNKELSVLIYKAAYIRFKLFSIIHKCNNNLEIEIDKESNSDESFDIILKSNQLNNEIELLRLELGHEFKFHDDKIIIDYAIPKNIHLQNLNDSLLFFGERKFLYDCFQLIYSEDLNFKSYHYLFHAYINIKSQFRAELIAVNKKIGFGNFLLYQNRKESFINESSIYYNAFINLAVRETKKNCNLLSLELRIAPKENAQILESTIQKFNKLIEKISFASTQLNLNPYELENNPQGSNTNQGIYYVLHFIKEKDKEPNNLNYQSIYCRNYKLRNKIKRQAIAIGRFRESYSSNSKYLKGIDAASSEFAAQPEVFAQAFRYIKNHKVNGKFDHLKETIEAQKMFATYHVGEDFNDIVDGLRAIDDCVNFLNLYAGDRIGHALALGINVEEYYSFKENKMILSSQTLLDNIVWLLSKISQFGIASNRNEVNSLEALYENLYYEIFTKNLDKNNIDSVKNIPYSVYYDSYKLRGDDPYLYFENIDRNVYDIINFSYWDRCRINQSFPTNKNIRNNRLAKFITQQYHFNAKVKLAGEEIKQFNITTSYVELVKMVQYHMLFEFGRKQISIETNPTSNYLIGTFQKYANHPIKIFYNLGLETDPIAISKSPQISVSINTDDQGIFSTSLENEYAFLAISLLKERDNDGKLKYNSAQIYDWLYRIMKMGNNQSFT
ncbi:hypothetical protein GCM10027566_06390 [Arachidicoccus ginsenosidivorans]|uniref:adenosine deaminase n=1 Tax=Arachidicoccus ginsenosidivorans TaxID=496057 RepID=A0A5B8VUZ0_9BACT|nr:hypothetical protein [Arachidicoccus ginsenosidivorans]QEC73988.1 hypothetical protein FSB73_22275 [Arachidicoccus ginsenosidivorans]